MPDTLTPPFAYPRTGLALILGAACCASAAVLLSSCSNSPARPSAKKQREQKYLVRTAPVIVRPITYELETTGVLQARDVFRVDAQVPGVVEDISFNEGDQVTRETVLCRIAPRTYDLAAQLAKAAWQKAKDAHARAQADVLNAERRSRNAIDQSTILCAQSERDYRRRKSAFDAGAITEEELLNFQDKRDLAALVLKDAREAAQTEVDVMRAAAREKEADARQAEVAWRQAEDNLRKSSVVSPVAGRIEERMATNGAQAAPGTSIALVVDPELRLRFTLPEEQVARVRMDSRVSFRVMAYPERDVPAHIYHIGALTDTKTRLVTVWAKAETPQDMVLKPGFFSTVKVVTDQRAEAVVAPLSGVMPSEQGFVAFVVENGLAIRRLVKLGLQLGDTDVEIVSGLSAGERLVVEGGPALQPNVKIEEAGAAQTPASPGARKTPATSGAVETPATSGAVETPATSGAVETPETSGAVETPATSGAVETPATSGAVETPATSGAAETPAMPGARKTSASPAAVESERKEHRP